MGRWKLNCSRVRRGSLESPLPRLGTLNQAGPAGCIADCQSAGVVCAPQATRWRTAGFWFGERPQFENYFQSNLSRLTLAATVKDVGLWHCRHGQHESRPIRRLLLLLDMLEDRDHTRQPELSTPRWRRGFRVRWTWTMTLVAIYVAVLLAEQITAARFPRQNFIFNYLALSRAGLAHGYVWQLVTYQFMHAGWLHLLLNSWAIMVFGTELEYVLGARRYLALLFSSGIVGGLFQMLTALVWPTVFDGTVVGASAGAFGLVAAFATIFPERELMLLILFVIPVRLRAKTLLLVCLVVALLGIFFPWDNVANAAHLGGMVTGWLWITMSLKKHALAEFAQEDRPLSPRTANSMVEARVEPSGQDFP